MQSSILTKSSELIYGMFDIAMGRKYTALALTILKFHQFVVQALWSPLDSPYLQLPHVDIEIINEIQKAYKNVSNYLLFLHFLNTNFFNILGYYFPRIP